MQSYIHIRHASVHMTVKKNRMRHLNRIERNEDTIYNILNDTKYSSIPRPGIPELSFYSWGLQPPCYECLSMRRVVNWFYELARARTFIPISRIYNQLCCLHLNETICESVPSVISNFERPRWCRSGSNASQNYQTNGASLSQYSDTLRDVSRLTPASMAAS